MIDKMKETIRNIERIYEVVFKEENIPYLIVDNSKTFQGKKKNGLR